MSLKIFKNQIPINKKMTNDYLQLSFCIYNVDSKYKNCHLGPILVPLEGFIVQTVKNGNVVKTFSRTTMQKVVNLYYRY